MKGCGIGKTREAKEGRLGGWVPGLSRRHQPCRFRYRASFQSPDDPRSPHKDAESSLQVTSWHGNLPAYDEPCTCLPPVPLLSLMLGTLLFRRPGTLRASVGRAVSCSGVAAGDPLCERMHCIMVERQPAALIPCTPQVH